MGDISLSNNEQVTFVSKSNGRYDICKKSWGYYATPSINSRLKKEGFKYLLKIHHDESKDCLRLQWVLYQSFEPHIPIAFKYFSFKLWSN